MAREPVIILPTNVKTLQRLIAATEAWSIGKIEIYIDTLWNADLCPLKFLPYLAWALSVDHWQDDWPETTKRRVIKASPLVHFKKGTIFAIRTALEALGIQATITEWHNESPPARRGTFKIDVFVNEYIYADQPLLNQRIQNDAIAFVKAAKPKSRVFSFRLGLSAEGKVGVAASHATAEIARVCGSAGAIKSFRTITAVVAVQKTAEIINLCGVASR